jgi:hypothetical protein
MHRFHCIVPAILFFFLLPIASLSQWTQISTGVTSDIGCVRYTSSGQVWAGTINGVLRSSNSGATFNFVNGINTAAGNTQIYGSFDDIHITGPSSAVATGFFYLGNDLIVFNTTNNAASWGYSYYSNTGSLMRYIDGMDFNAGTGAVAVGSGGRILYSNNNGVSWSIGSAGTTNDLYDVSWVNGNTWVAVSGSNIYRSTNGGVSFTSVAAGQSSIENVSFARGTNTGYAGGSNVFLKSTDGGLTWSALSVPLVSIRTIFTLSPDTVFIGTFDGVYRSISGGAYWERFDLPNFQRANDVYFYDGDNGMVAGDSGYIAVTSSAGGATYPVANFTLSSNSPCQGAPVTLTNYGDPAWSFQWMLNGSLVSTQFAPVITFPLGGSNILELIATKNGLSDTLTRTVNTIPIPVVAPFTVINDTICQGGQGRFYIPNSQPFVSYRLFDGTTPVGSGQNGNNSMLTLTTATNQTVVKPYRIQAVYTNACGTDTLEVTDSLYLAIPAPNVSALLYRDTICTGDTTTMLIYNSEPGWEYYCSNATFLRVDGTGGTIGIPVGPVTGNVTITVTARFKALNCFKTLPGTFPLVFRSSSVSIPGTLQGAIGQAVNMTATSTGFNNWSWSFGANASPSTGNGQVPSPPVYSVAGIDTVVLMARLNSTCEKVLRKPVYIYGSIPASSTVLCDADTFSGTLANSAYEFYLDDYNNLHVAGYNAQSTNFAFTPYVMRIDSAGSRTYYHTFNAFGNNPGAQGLINGITSDPLTNTYFVTRYTAPSRFDIQGNYMRNKNALIKLNSKGKFQWAIEAPLADFSDMITIGDRIFAIGVNAWNGCEFQTPLGLYRYTPSISNKGDAFVMELSAAGEILQFDAFGGSGTAGLTSPAQFRVKYPIVNQYFDYDTLRQNLMARKSQSNGLLMAGMLSAAGLATPVYFNNQLLNNSLPVGTGLDKCLFIARYDLTNGFDQAVTLMAGRPEFIADFKENVNGQYIVAGRAKNNVVTSNGTLTFPVQNYEYQFLASFSPSGAVNWLVYADSMNFKSVGVNNDGSASLLVHMTTKFLIVDALGNPYNVSPLPSAGSYLLRFGLNGELLSADRTAGFEGLALRQDDCGNHRVYHATNGGAQFRAYRTVHSNSGGCAANCYAAYSPGLLDAALDSVTLNDKTTNGPAVRNIAIKIKSKSVVPLTALDVRCRINNDPVQVLNWSGNMLTGDSVTLNVNNYNFTKTYNRIRVWIDRVNNVTDDMQENDTIVLGQIICSSPLAGVYSVGCDTCYFDSIQTSASTLKACGVSDPVTMAIEPGEYLEQLRMDSIPFASQSDSVVWTSRTGQTEDVTILFKPNYSYSRTLVYLDRLSHCSFTHLTLKNLLPRGFDAMQADAGGRSVFYLNASRYIRIEHCNLSGIDRVGGASGTANIIDAYTASQININDNRFENGEFAIAIGGSLTASRNLIITDNEARQTRGFHFYQADSLLIDRNRIENIGDITPAVLLCTDCDSFRITRNQVTSEDWGDEVLDVSCTCPPANPCLIANNIFSSAPLWLTVAGATINGTNLDVVNNSFGHGVLLYSNGGLRFVNNLVRSNGSFALDVSSPTFINTLDFNRYQSVGAPINFKNNGNNYSLAGWRTLTGFDSQSDSVTASYTTLTDMHLRSTVSMAGTPWPGITTDIDGQARNASAPTVGADEYSFNPAISEVWPGDCDSTKSVDNFDLLPIGLYYTRFSTSRPNESSVAWAAEPSLLWPLTQGTGINMHHADADGDGWIGLDDTTVVINNYGQTHPLAQPQPARPALGPDLAVIPVGTVFNAGDTVHLKVVAGTGVLPVERLSAIGFKVEVPPSLIVPGSFRVSIAGNWLCPDSNCIMYPRADEVTGVAAVSLARLDGDQVSSYGELADVSFAINAAYTGGTTITIPVSDYRSFEPDAVSIPLSPLAGVIQVLGTSVEETTSIEGVKLYPNPATQSATLWFNWRGAAGEKMVLTIADMAGRTVAPPQTWQASPGAQQIPVDCSALQQGIYLVRLSTGSESTVLRLIRQ